MKVIRYFDLHRCKFAGVLLLAFSSSLFAGGPDIQPATNNWSGFYVGGEFGGGWAHGYWRLTNNNYFNTLGAALVGRDFNAKTGSVIGGIDVGANYQTGHLLLGLSGSGLASGFRKDFASPFFPNLDTFKYKLHWLSTAEGRLGYANEHWLTYATGGYAGGDLYLELHSPDSGGVTAKSSEWRNGWTTGVGVDYRLSRHTSLGAAYHFIRLKMDNETIGCPNCGTGVGFGTPKADGHVDVSRIVGKFNYLF